MKETRLIMPKNDVATALEYYLNHEVLKNPVGVTDIKFDKTTMEVEIELCDEAILKANEKAEAEAKAKVKNAVGK